MGGMQPVLGKLIVEGSANDVKMLAYPRYGADALRFALDADAWGYGL